MSPRLSRILKAGWVSMTLTLSTGCLVFTSISDLGPGTPPDESGNGASEGPSNDAGFDGQEPSHQDVSVADGGSYQFGAPFVLTQTTPGLRGIAVDSTHVYFSNEVTGEIRYIEKTGGKDAGSAVLTTAIAPTDIGIDATRVYWIQDDPNVEISKLRPAYSIRKDGSDQRNIGSTYFRSVRMTMVGAQVFTITWSSVWSIRRDGVALVGLSGLTMPRAVVSDGVTVYYEDRNIVHTYPAGDGGASFANAEARDLAVDETSVYWVTMNGVLQKLDKDKPGETPTDLASNLVSPVRIALDAQYVYVTMWGTGMSTGRVVRVPKSGGEPVDLATGLSEPWGIAVDATGVYVTVHGDGTVLAIPRE